MSLDLGKDDIVNREADRSPRIQAAPRGRGKPDDETEKKRLILAVAVTSVTVVIVAAWLLTLPMQLDRLQLLDDDSVARWYAISGEVQSENVGIQEQLDRMKAQLEEAAGELDAASSAAGGASGSIDPEDVAERLRAKIMGLESENQTEQDATTQEDQQ